MADLVDKGVVIKIGDKRGTFYMLKRCTSGRYPQCRTGIFDWDAGLSGSQRYPKSISDSWDIFWDIAGHLALQRPVLLYRGRFRAIRRSAVAKRSGSPVV